MGTAVQGQAPLGPSLRELVSRGPHGVGDADLVLATGITALDISDNPNITTVAPFARTLRKLTARGSHCRIWDRNLALATRLEHLESAGHHESRAVLLDAAPRRGLPRGLR